MVEELPYMLLAAVKGKLGQFFAYFSPVAE
jgi:hypothetical protein